MAQEIHVYNGVSWVQANEVHVYNGVSWVEADEVHVYNGVSWEQVYSKAASAVVNLDGEGAFGACTWVSNVATTVGLRVNSDGTIDRHRNGSYSQIDALTDWIIPNSAASDKTYHVKGDWTGDSLLAGSAATGTWLNVSTNPHWLLRDTTADDGAQTGTLTLSISDDGGSTTLDSATYAFSADYDTT